MPRASLARPTAAAAAGLLLAGAMALAVSPAGAAESTLASMKRIELGGYTDSSLALGLAINDGKASRYPSSTGPTGLAGKVTDVDVRIEGFSHERPRDVDILLVAPNGQTVVLMSDVGGTIPVTGLDLTFDDQAMAEVDPAAVPQTGTWRPSNEDAADDFPAPAPATTPAGSLSVLNGQRPGGNWALYVVDDTFDYFGSITEFWIDIETSGPTAYPSTITASGLPSVVTDVDVTLTRLRHIWAPDLDLMLVGPQGQQATFFSDVNGLVSNSVDLTFDDSASDNLPQSIVSGTYRPVNNFGADDFPAPAPTATGASSLSVFNGTNPNGDWELYVVDDRESDAGTLDGWSLRITTEDPSTPTPSPSPAPTPTPSPTPGQDTTHPRVTAKRPAAQATGVRRGAKAAAVLDEPVTPSTVNRATAYLVRRGAPPTPPGRRHLGPRGPPRRDRPAPQAARGDDLPRRHHHERCRPRRQPARPGPGQGRAAAQHLALHHPLTCRQPFGRAGTQYEPSRPCLDSYDVVDRSATPTTHPAQRWGRASTAADRR